MTIGSKDGNASKSDPTIIGETVGILNEGTFNFYDGIVHGRTEAIEGPVTDSETTLEDDTTLIDGKTYHSKYNG